MERIIKIFLIFLPLFSLAANLAATGKMSYFGAVNEAYGACFASVLNLPARATFQVAGLPKNTPVEIKVTAFRVL